MRMISKGLAALALTGVLATAGGGVAMAAEPTHHSSGSVVVVAAEMPGAGTAELAAAKLHSYTFSAESTQQLYKVVTTGANSAISALCNAVVPAPLSATVCPFVVNNLNSIEALGAPAAGQRLRISVQFGWPPIMLEYVK